MWLEMGRLFTQLSDDPNVRSIVLSGAGEKAFTTGLDVQAATTGLLSNINTSQADTARKAVQMRRFVSQFQECINAVERCEKPVIVAMHGYCFGLAIDLSTAADVRVCSSDAKFSVKEVDIGMAADIGTLSRLPKIVGSLGWVKEVSLTARTWGGEEAKQVGFANEVYSHGGKGAAVRGALGLAGLIAEKSPVAVQGTKELLNWSRDRGVADGLRYTTVWNSAALQTGDMPQALLSGVKKRTPTFEKL